MLSMTESSELDEIQSEEVDVSKRHFSEDVKFYPISLGHQISLYLHLLYYLISKGRERVRYILQC